MKARSETRYAVAAARAAGAIALRRVDADVVTVKGALDIATGSDLAAEDAILALLREGCPDIPVVGEERGGEPPHDGAPYFLVDPLCGTLSFATRLPTFCTNIALVEAGVVTASAVFDGASGEVYWAERGGGAWVERESGSQALAARDGAVLGLELAGKPVFTGSTRALGALFAALLEAGRWAPRLIGSTLPFARVATGDYAGLLLLGRISAPLHSAAGCLLAEEAGARVTTPQGQAWDLASREFVVAATAELHEALLSLHARAFQALLT